jgi:vacuolar-type H+-ATPase subunit H
MQKDILDKIIEVGKEIQEQLRLEKMKSEELLEKVRQEIEEELQSTEKRLEETYDKALNEAKMDAEKEALRIVEQSQSISERIQNIDDETLKRILLKHLKGIIIEVPS